MHHSITIKEKTGGCRVVAASDSTAGIYNPNGLDVDDVIRHKRETGSLRGYPKADPIVTREVLEVPCEFLVPAALEDQITIDNVGRIETKIIVEAANGPTTAEADHVLNEKGILAIPDILANAGGVCVSHLEWVQDLQGYYWSEEEVNRILEATMVRSFNDVFQISQRDGVDMRTAAYMLGIGRIAEATALRGIWP